MKEPPAMVFVFYREQVFWDLSKKGVLFFRDLKDLHAVQAKRKDSEEGKKKKQKENSGNGKVQLIADVDLEKPSQSLPLASIKHLYTKMGSDAFMKPSQEVNNANPDWIFSVTGADPETSLELEADSKAIKTDWVNALTALIKLHNLDVQIH